MTTIYHDIDIKASAEAIFQMITQPVNLNEWWTVKAKGKPTTNEFYNFYFSEQYNWFAKVKSVTKNISICYAFTEADTDWNQTELYFEIINNSKDAQTLRF